MFLSGLFLVTSLVPNFVLMFGVRRSLVSHTILSLFPLMKSPVGATFSFVCSAVVAAAARANCSALKCIIFWSFPWEHLPDTECLEHQI